MGSNDSLFASQKGFYSRDSHKKRFDPLNHTIGGTRGGFGLNSRRLGFSRMNQTSQNGFSYDGDKENRRDKQNLVHPYMGIRSYQSYGKMKYKSFVDRTARLEEFSERVLLLEMQK